MTETSKPDLQREIMAAADVLNARLKAAAAAGYGVRLVMSAENPKAGRRHPIVSTCVLTKPRAT